MKIANCSEHDVFFFCLALCFEFCQNVAGRRENYGALGATPPTCLSTRSGHRDSPPAWRPPERAFPPTRPTSWTLPGVAIYGDIRRSKSSRRRCSRWPGFIAGPWGIGLRRWVRVGKPPSCRSARVGTRRGGRPRRSRMRHGVVRGLWSQAQQYASPVAVVGRSPPKPFFMRAPIWGLSLIHISEPTRPY